MLNIPSQPRSSPFDGFFPSSACANETCAESSSQVLPLPARGPGPCTMIQLEEECAAPKSSSCGLSVV